MKMATKGGLIRGQDLVSVGGTCRLKDKQNLAQLPDPVSQHDRLVSSTGSSFDKSMVDTR